MIWIAMWMLMPPQDGLPEPRVFRLNNQPNPPVCSADGANLATLPKTLQPACPIAELRPGRRSSSLTGLHQAYQQYHNGFPVEGAEFILTLDEKGVLMRVFDATLRPPERKSVEVVLSEEDALDLAWQALDVRKGLNGPAHNQLTWVVAEGAWHLCYRVELSIEVPYGAWRCYVEAQTGELLGQPRDTHIYRQPFERDAQETSLPLLDRRQDFQRFERERGKAISTKTAKRADGLGLVFDPDPVTTLRTHLEDNSPAATFDSAYQITPLRDIAFEQGSYALNGPWVSIQNFDSPNTPPSKSPDGQWTAKRGNNAFNDAMTYFHLDQSQRYMQALGFTGSRAIQNVSIATDTDALNGADNSQFSPGQNRLSFGHGCVDDNEDADVILHEYGHAIQYFINNNWFGGDTGAMGEGFGDYWAGSYSFKTPNGPHYHPEWMFTWDGHNNCWDGRVFDALSLTYDANRNYQAHAPISGTPYVTDELWSTPLFQAMLELHDRGVRLEEVDAAILESHFGLGAGVKMNVLAQAVVDAAARLFPAGPHAELFRAAFARHGILPPASAHELVAAHVPPAGSDPGAWTSQIQLVNPHGNAAVVSYEVWEAGDSGFQQTATGSFNLAAGAVHSFTPEGSGQRWARFSSSLPLAGSTHFQRSPRPTSGQEQSAIPLLDATHRGKELVFPHVPSDRAKFWSGGVLVNLGQNAASVTFTLWGDAGSDLSHLLKSPGPLLLSPRQKWVSLFAGTLFDDNNSSEKVAYIAVHGDSDLMGFQLYGFQSVDGAVATSGIAAAPDQVPAFWMARLRLNQTDWAGITVLNPNADAVQLDLELLDEQGAVVDSASVSMAGRAKWLGLNLPSGFNFPYRSSQPTIFATTAPPAALRIRCAAPLRLFELTGNGSSTTLDGSACPAPRSHVVLTQSGGSLEIINGGLPGEIALTARDASGTVLPAHSTTLNLAPWESTNLDLSSWNAASIQLTGRQLAVYGYHRDEAADSLTVSSPAQIAGLVPRTP
jgi:hypothetical protein